MGRSRVYADRTYDAGYRVSFGVNLRAGSLRHRVRFLRRRPGADELGEPLPYFDLLFETWAGIQPLNGREFFAAAQHVQNVDTKITIRYLPNQSVTASDRCVVDGPQGGEFDIQAPLVPEYAGEALVIYARRVNEGASVLAPTPVTEAG